jgi:hypothetical protein
LDHDLRSSLPVAERTPAQWPASLLTRKAPDVSADATATHEEKRATLVSFLRATWGTHAWALADQAVVSGTSFITTIVIGRWCLPSELGIYSLGISLLVSWLAVQESVISLPYIIYRQRPVQGTPPEHAGSSLAHNALLSVLAIAVLGVTAMGLSARGAELAADLVGARIYHLLSVGMGRWYGGYWGVRRVHERCVVLKPFHHGDQQYFGSESRLGLA